MLTGHLWRAVLYDKHSDQCVGEESLIVWARTHHNFSE